MKQFIVFNADRAQYVVSASSWVRAVQAAIVANPDSIAQDWTAQDLSWFNEKLRLRLINESVKL